MESVFEKEFTSTFVDIDEATFNILKQCEREKNSDVSKYNVERTYKRTENDPRFDEAYSERTSSKLSVDNRSNPLIKAFTSGRFDAFLRKKYKIDEHESFHLRQIETYNGKLFIPSVNICSQVVKQIKVINSVDESFFIFENDLIPFTHKESRELQLHVEDSNRYDIKHSKLNTVCVRWISYINPNIENCTGEFFKTCNRKLLHKIASRTRLRIALDKMEHFTKHLMYSVSFEMEYTNIFSELNTPLVKEYTEYLFLQTLCAQSYYLRLLLNCVNQQPVNPAIFSQSNIKRNFRLYVGNENIKAKSFHKSHNNSKALNRNVKSDTYFCSKLDGTKGVGLIHSKGITFSHANGVMSTCFNVPIKQKYLVTVELIDVLSSTASENHSNKGGNRLSFFIIDVHAVLRYKYDFFKDFTKQSTMFEYTDEFFNVTPTCAVKFIKTVLSVFCDTQMFFETLQDAVSYRLSDPLANLKKYDGYLKIEKDIFYKIKQTHTIDLKFDLRRFLKSIALSRATPKQIKKIILTNLKSDIFLCGSLLEKVSAQQLNTFCKFFYCYNNKNIRNYHKVNLTFVHTTTSHFFEKLTLGTVVVVRNDDLNNLENSKTLKLLNNAVIVEFNCKYSATLEEFDLEFNRVRKDRLHADTKLKIENSLDAAKYFAQSW